MKPVPHNIFRRSLICAIWILALNFNLGVIESYASEEDMPPGKLAAMQAAENIGPESDDATLPDSSLLAPVADTGTPDDIATIK
ncbi:MAG: hypothetical protein LUQ11_02600, partial [Methylococcaceae bacterium]|nr:hypothetical protein [Methylococcaceae bacterium]